MEEKQWPMTQKSVYNLVLMYQHHLVNLQMCTGLCVVIWCYTFQMLLLRVLYLLVSWQQKCHTNDPHRETCTALELCIFSLDQVVLLLTKLKITKLSTSCTKILERWVYSQNFFFLHNTTTLLWLIIGSIITWLSVKFLKIIN